MAARDLGSHHGGKVAATNISWKEIFELPARQRRMRLVSPGVLCWIPARCFSTQWRITGGATGKFDHERIAVCGHQFASRAAGNS